MDEIAIVSEGRTSCRSQFVEKGLGDLAEMAVTEACLSGLCDICLYDGTGLCAIFGQNWGDSRPARRPTKQKNTSGAIE